MRLSLKTIQAGLHQMEQGPLEPVKRQRRHSALMGIYGARRMTAVKPQPDGAQSQSSRW